MDNLTLESSLRTDITSVSNIFIDEYMPKANGDFVKVYLHLLRLISDRRSDINLSCIADRFNFTEGDVLRALKYWEGLGLLTLSSNDCNVINGIRLEPFGFERHYIKGVHSMHLNKKELEDSVQEDIPSFPEKKHYSTDEINTFASDNMVGQLMFIAQAYLGKPLSSTDINCILYMYDALNLSTDFIEYVIETSISNGCKTLTSIEKMALELYRHNIKDIDSAKDYYVRNSSLGKKVLDAFGITGRLPGKEENSFILKWQDEFGYSDDLIVEACNRTIAHIHNPSFKYANTILASWYNSGVKSIEDISKLDSEFANAEAKKVVAKKTAGVAKAKHKAGQKIESRQYDFSSLEKQLIK